MRFPNTLETVAGVELAHLKGQWKIGEAIQDDLKTVDLRVSRKMTVLQDCSVQLVAKGFRKYGARYLGQLYDTAIAFPRGERDDRYSWDIHYRAGTPENLRKAATALRKLDRTINEENVQWLMQEWREKEKVERAEANAKAEAEREAARKKRQKAAEDALKAKDKEARKKARQEHQKAKAEELAAKQRATETAKAPKVNEDVTTDLQDQNTLTIMALHLGITQRAKQIEKLAKLSLEEVRKIEDSITPEMAAQIVDGVELIIDIVNQIKTTVRGFTRKTLKVHQGGAA
jgi:hypothetical protein